MTITITAENKINVGDNVYHIDDMNTPRRVVKIISEKSVTIRHYTYYSGSKKVAAKEYQVEIE